MKPRHHAENFILQLQGGDAIWVEDSCLSDKLKLIMARMLHSSMCHDCSYESSMEIVNTMRLSAHTALKVRFSNTSMPPRTAHSICSTAVHVMASALALALFKYTAVRRSEL